MPNECFWTIKEVSLVNITRQMQPTIEILSVEVNNNTGLQTGRIKIDHVDLTDDLLLDMIQEHGAATFLGDATNYKLAKHKLNR